MKLVRRGGTAPELAVRKILSKLGLRYRLNVRSLPGTPDVANQAARWALFVHGCFWHRHAGCRLASTPKSNQAFWSRKFDANVARDARKERALVAAGFRVVTVWQCELADPSTLERRLAREIPRRLSPTSDSPPRSTAETVLRAPRRSR